MREDEGFDLSTTLAGLTGIANPYTEITILSVSQQLLHFRASKLLPAKTKQFKIMYSPEQAVSQLRKLVSGLRRFPTKKLVIGKEDPLIVTLKDSLEQIKLTSLFEGVLFDQIRVQLSPYDPQATLASILNSFLTLKVAFLQPLDVKSTVNLLPWLHSNLLSPQLILSFQVKPPIQADLLLFATHWIESLSPTSALKQQKYFGYPFPLSNKKQHYIGRREQISLVYDGREVVTARQMEEEGRFFVISRVNNCKFASQLLKVLFQNEKGVSVQMGELPSEEVVILAEFVSRSFQGRYRLVIAHQLELSPCRIVVNTSGMNREQVERMIKIAAEPGRYEIILYSQLLYFQSAVKLFLQKPLIKFNFFLPYQSSTPELQALLSRIDHKCQHIKRYAYEYAALLSRYSGFGYIFVSSLFESLTYQS